MVVVKYICILLLLLWNLPSKAQEIRVQFFPNFGESKLLWKETTEKIEIDKIEIETAKFYISNIRLLQNGKIVYSDRKAFLLDASDTNTLFLNIQKNNASPFDAISFDLGIDSITNVSGVLGGDLDPTKGMYWTWQSGYINCKLEGKNILCKSRNHAFQFHLGGYQSPNNCLQNITLPCTYDSLLKIGINFEKVLAQINFAEQDHIMSPSTKAVLLSQQLAQSFSILD